MNDGSPSAPDEDLLGPILDSFLNRFRRGERPSVTELITRRPELSGQIRELIPALVEMEQLAGLPGTPGDWASQRPGSGAGRDEGRAPERLGDYRIIRRIGGGGMGVVYQAEHEPLRRIVALKVIHPRFRDDARYLRRFHGEARLAAGLHHTNIVDVFDYGEQEGVCYYAMQLIQGQPLDRVLADIRLLRAEQLPVSPPGQAEPTRASRPISLEAECSRAAIGLLTGRFAAVAVTDELADATTPIGVEEGAAGPAPGSSDGQLEVIDHPSSLGSSTLGHSGEQQYYREIARIGAQIAEALEYAHRRRIVHRDIKPSNLLLDAMGNVWVTDFGLSKVEDGAELTQSRELVGTLRYMAPERIGGKSDHRGDIYSLGATLYELLTLRPAFDGTDELRLLESIRAGAPMPPRRLDPKLPRDLETIVLKALASDPQDRFSTAGAMADDLRRFVERRPIRSRPVSIGERFWRWCRRDPWLAGASVAAVVLAISLTAVALVAAWNDRKQLRAIGAARNEARLQLFEALVDRARAGRFSHRVGQRFESLAALKRAAALARELRLPADRLNELRDYAIACLALPDLEPTGRVVARPAGVIVTAFDPAMSRYAHRFRDGTISVRRFDDDREIARFTARGDRDVWVFGFSPDGRYLATTNVPGNSLVVWDVDNGAAAIEEPGPVEWRAARFSPDSRRIALLTPNREVIVYNVVDRRVVARWPVQGLGNLAYRPDGRQLAVVINEKESAKCLILEAETGQVVRRIPLPATAAEVAWAPDDRTLAVTGWDSKIYLCDTARGIQYLSLPRLNNQGVSASFHPAGTLFASNDWSGDLRISDPMLGQPLLRLASSVAPEFSRDGRIVVGQEERLTVYRADPALEYRTMTSSIRDATGYEDVSIRHDGRILALGTEDGFMLWDLAHGSELGLVRIGNAWHLMFDASGDLITGGDSGVQRWPIRLDLGRGEVAVGRPQKLPLNGGWNGIGVDRSGRIVARADWKGADLTTPEGTFRVEPLDDCRTVAVSPDGKWLATGSHVASHGAQVWRISDRKQVADLPIDHGAQVIFRPDGTSLMTSGPPCQLWEVGTWNEVTRIAGYARAFSPDGRLLVVQEVSKALRLVEVATGRTLARLEGPDSCTPSAVCFSPDGSRLVFTTKDGPAVHIWDLRAVRKQLAGLGLDWDAPAYSEDDPASPSAPMLSSAQPFNSERLYAEADALAYAGRWEQAAVTLARALTTSVPENAVFPFENAILHLAVGDRAAYELIRLQMLESIRNVSDVRQLAFTAHAFVVADDEPRVTARALELARVRFTNTPDLWTEHVLGLALYRAGRFDEAGQVLEHSLNRDPDWDYQVLNWLALSLVHQRLARPDEARRLLARAERWLAVHRPARPGEVERGIPKNWAWRDGILLHLLLREARTLIRPEPTTLPADVFTPAP